MNRRTVGCVLMLLSALSAEAAARAERGVYYLGGDVDRAGVYELVRDTTLTEAIRLADKPGGRTDRLVQVLRKGNDGKEAQVIKDTILNISKLPKADQLVRPGDKVMVLPPAG